MTTYDETNKSFRYFIDVKYAASEDLKDEYGNVLLASGDVIKDVENENVTAEVYIGVKGDINLDNEVDAADASQALEYYASVMNDGKSSDEIILSQTRDDLVTSPTSIYDNFAAFLGDVDVVSANNGIVAKSERVIDSSDASNILKYYGESYGSDLSHKELWNKVLGSE